MKFLPKDHGYRFVLLGWSILLFNKISESYNSSIPCVRYEMSNCLFEAAFENIPERCKCAPGFHMMGGDEAMEKYEICMGANLTCMNDLMNRMGKE